MASVAAGNCLPLLVVLAASLVVSAARSSPIGSGCSGGGVPGASAQARALTGRALLTSPASTNVSAHHDGAHQPLHLSGGTAAALVLAPLVSALSNAAGVGGGAVFVPLFSVLLSISIKAATALSQAVITGGAIGSVAFSLTRQHPLRPGAPLIDFSLALTLLPPLLLGVATGVLLNLALPAWLVTILLIPLLITFAIRTAATGLSMRRAEKQAQQWLQPQSACSSSGQLLVGPQPEPSPKLCLELVRRSVAIKAPRSSRSLHHLLAAAGSGYSVAGNSSDGSAAAQAASPSWHIAAAGGAEQAGQQQQQASASPSKQSEVRVELEEAAAAEEGAPEPLRWSDAPTLLDGVLDDELMPMHSSQRLSLHGSQQQLQRSSTCSDGLAIDCQQRSQSQQTEHEESRCNGMAGAGGSDTTQGDCLPAPWSKLAKMGLLWIAFLGLTLGKAHFGRCSWQHGLLFGLQALLALALSALFSWQAMRAQRGQRGGNETEPILSGTPSSSSADAGTAYIAAGLDAVPGWTARQLAAASAISLVGGALAGTLGLGGGMVMAPLLIELGVHPSSAAATSGLCVLFSASTALGVFAAAGRINLVYAAVFGTACLAAACLGTFLIGRAVRRSGLASSLVLLLAAVIGLGALATTVFSGRTAVLDLMHGASVSGPGFCG